MYLACSNFWRRSSIDGNTLACILSQDSRGGCDFRRKPLGGVAATGEVYRDSRNFRDSKGRESRILGISGAQLKCADEQTLAGPRMALEGRESVLPIERCDQAFRSRGTPLLEPGSSRATDRDPLGAYIRNRRRRDRPPTRSVPDYAESHAAAHCPPSQ